MLISLPSSVSEMRDFSPWRITNAYCGYAVLLTLVLALCSCRANTSAVPPTPQLEQITRERRQIRFVSQGVRLAGELDLPLGDAPAPLAFVIHHSGPVDRDSYGYLAELLVQEGYAVFRFDKRGTGASGGEYGCCESLDALAAYRAVVPEDGIDRCNVFIVAQSIGTRHLVERFEGYARAQPPRGVVLLSSLLDAHDIQAIRAPVHIVISDSEPRVEQLGRLAVEAHQDKYPFGASYYVAEQTEHTLFEIRTGPIDWNDPEWTQRYHRGAIKSLINWLDSHRRGGPRSSRRAASRKHTNPPEMPTGYHNESNLAACPCVGTE
jgi:pimeloyl-ACP methyl ester carboxylesterase